MTDSAKSGFTVAISAEGEDLDAQMSSVFGRCSTFIFVNPETGEFVAKANPAKDLPHGAGRKSAQFVIDEGAKILIAPQLGPKAKEFLEAGDIDCRLRSSALSVKDALASLSEDDHK